MIYSYKKTENIRYFTRKNPVFRARSCWLKTYIFSDYFVRRSKIRSSDKSYDLNHYKKLYFETVKFMNQNPPNYTPAYTGEAYIRTGQKPPKTNFVACPVFP